MTSEANLPHKAKKATTVYWLSGILLLALAAAYFPQFKYHLEGDATGYIGSVTRYVSGDYFNAINGYWSPLSIWLTAIGVKITGLNIVTVAYAINALSMLGIICLSIRLFNKYINVGVWEQYTFGLGIALFWFVQMQTTLFADGLSTFILLIILSVLLKEKFVLRPTLWILVGLLGAIAYFAKSYSFYAVPLLTLALSAYQLHSLGKPIILKTLQILFVTCGLMLVFSFPWLYLLHNKYKIWTLSTVGTLTNSWYVFGVMYFGDEIKQLVPPPYSNSLSCWDDLWFHKGKMYGFFDSPRIVGLRLRRLIINLFSWPSVASSLSPFYFTTWVISLSLLFSKKAKSAFREHMPIILAFLLFPIGYFTLLISERYIWFTVPLGMIITMVIMTKFIFPSLGFWARRVLFTLFVLSWIPTGLMQVIKARDVGKRNYEIALQLQKLGITKGSFFTNDGMNDMNKVFQIAYYSHNRYYMNFNSTWTLDAVLQDAEKFDVKYYFHFQSNTDQHFELKNTLGIPYKELTDHKIEGLKVFQLR